jgi:acetyl esterase/lipase
MMRCRSGGSFDEVSQGAAPNRASLTMHDYRLMRRTLQRCIFLAGLALSASSPAQQGIQEIPLWSEDEPMPFEKAHNVQEYTAESWGETCVFNVTEPTLTIYPGRGVEADRVVIILPGGGYEAEAIHHEGYDVAEVFSQQGIRAAVLKYRLPDPSTSTAPHRVPLADVRRAIRLLRGGKPDRKVGLLGFSAGSHLATVASVWQATNALEQPDFSILIYGVTTLPPDHREWLEQELYHRKLSAEEIRMNRLVDQVSPSTPPAFLVHAFDDEVCDYHGSTDYADALVRQGVPVEMHLFPKGGHGFGLGSDSDGTSQWPALAVEWIKRL